MMEQEHMHRKRVLGLALPEFIAFTLYCCVQIWMCLAHEAWGDEAQAWLLARDNSLLDLFYRRLHYEGTPGLWHLLLWVETRLGISYRGMHFVTSALAAAGVYLFLRFAPLPRWLKLLFPFVFAILYQGPIVARSYLLTLPLIAALSVLRRKSRQRPVVYALLLGVLVNTSALGALLAMGLLAEWLFSALRGRWLFARSAMLRAAMVTLLLWAAALYSMVPAPDAHFDFLDRVPPHSTVQRVLGKLTGTALPESTGLQVTKPAVVDSPPDAPMQQAHRNRFQQKLYELKFPRGKATFVTHLLRHVLLVLSFNLFAISPSNLLAIAFYFLLVLWLAKHHALRFGLPLALLAMVGPKLYISPHHAMVWWFALLGLIWTAWPETKGGAQPDRTHLAFQALLALVLVQQVAFAGHAIYFDHRYAFDGGEAAERFITQSSPPGTVVAYTFFPVSMQPYSPVNLFVNQPATYERWKRQDNIDLAISTVTAYHPRMVVVGESYTGTSDPDSQIIPVSVPGTLLVAAEERRYLTSHGFSETHRFCGDQPINFGTYEKVCQIVFEPLGDERK